MKLTLYISCLVLSISIFSQPLQCMHSDRKLEKKLTDLKDRLGDLKENSEKLSVALTTLKSKLSASKALPAPTGSTESALTKKDQEDALSNAFAELIEAIKVQKTSEVIELCKKNKDLIGYAKEYKDIVDIDKLNEAIKAKGDLAVTLVTAYVIKFSSPEKIMASTDLPKFIP